MIKYFIYARKSTEQEDRQALSIPAQISELKEFALKENLKIIDIFIESKTAKTPGRKVFNEILAKIENNEAQGIIAWHPDRLARNSVDGGKTINLLDTGKLLDLKFPSFWFQNTPQGIFMLNMAFGQAKYYTDNLSVNTKRGLRQKARMGHFPGLAPKGYLNDKATKTIIIDKKISPLIKKVFRLYAKGIYTLQDMADFLAQNNLKTDYGHPRKKDMIKRLLTNPFYYGFFQYGGEIYEGKHQGLISKKLFDTVQEVVKRRGKKQKEGQVDHPFTRLMHCGECGLGITAEIQKGHTYYRCTKKLKTKKCFQSYAREETLTSQFNQIIQKVVLPRNWAKKMFRKIDEEEKQEKNNTKNIIQGFQTQLKPLKTRLERLLDAHLDQIISREEYLEKKEKLMSQKKGLEEKIIGLEKNGLVWLEPFKEWINLAILASKISQDDRDLYQKRTFLQKTGSNLILKDKKVSCFFKKPWAFLTERPTSRTWVSRQGLEP